MSIVSFLFHIYQFILYFIKFFLNFCYPFPYIMNSLVVCNPTTFHPIYSPKISQFRIAARNPSSIENVLHTSKSNLRSRFIEKLYRQRPRLSSHANSPRHLLNPLPPSRNKPGLKASRVVAGKNSLGQRPFFPRGGKNLFPSFVIEVETIPFLEYRFLYTNYSRDRSSNEILNIHRAERR